MRLANWGNQAEMIREDNYSFLQMTKSHLVQSSLSSSCYFTTVSFSVWISCKKSKCFTSYVSLCMYTISICHEQWGLFPLKIYWDFFEEKVRVYFFSSLADYVSGPGWNFVCWTYLKPKKGRKVPFKGQSVWGFEFGIFFTFKVFSYSTQISDFRSFSNALHMFILYWNIWLKPRIVKYPCICYYHPLHKTSLWEEIQCLRLGENGGADKIQMLMIIHLYSGKDRCSARCFTGR